MSTAGDSNSSEGRKYGVDASVLKIYLEQVKIRKLSKMAQIRQPPFRLSVVEFVNNRTNYEEASLEYHEYGFTLFFNGGRTEHPVRTVGGLSAREPGWLTSQYDGEHAWITLTDQVGSVILLHFDDDNEAMETVKAYLQNLSTPESSFSDESEGHDGGDLENSNEPPGVSEI